MAFNLSNKDNIVLSGERKKNRMIALLFILLLIAIVMVYFSFFRSAPNISSVIPERIASNEGDLTPEQARREIEFDVEILKNDRFKSLKSFGQWPPEIKEKGKINPFLP